MEKGTLKIKLKYNGVLKFAVNEPVLDTTDSKKNLYLISEEEDPQYENKRSFDVQKKTWEALKKGGYINQLWFDDNIGNFFIVITKKK